METVKIIFDGNEVEIPKSDLKWFQDTHGVELAEKAAKKTKED